MFLMELCWEKDPFTTFVTLYLKFDLHGIV